MHPIACVWRTDIGGHQVLLLQLVVEAGDAGEDIVSQVKVGGPLLFVSVLIDEVLLVLLTDITSLPEKPSPHLDAHDTKDEEDEETEEEDVTQHGQSVQQQHHQDPHT